jgi:hypothetical protein
MVRKSLYLSAVAACLLAGESPIPAAEDPPEGVFELRVYTCDPGRLDVLHARFRDHTIELFARHGMTNVAYFTPQDEPKSATTLVYVLKHESREAATRSFTAFRADPEWIAVKAESEKDARILALPVESTFMTATDYSEDIGPANKERVYELRIYTAEDGKLDALHQRFRDHTLKLFEKHGMKNIAYWTPMDEPKSENTLIYLVEHESRDAAAASWKAFIDDPEWKRVAAETEANGKLVQSIDAMYLLPTPYTPDE